MADEQKYKPSDTDIIRIDDEIQTIMVFGPAGQFLLEMTFTYYISEFGEEAFNNLKETP